MLYLYSLLLHLFFSAPEKTSADQPRLVISPLNDRFFVYTTYHDFEGSLFPSNSMYVVTEEGVVLLDTPWDSTQFQPLLDSIRARHQKEVVLCIATHFHADRTAGLEYYRQQGIKTYTSAYTYALGMEHGEKLPEFTFSGDTVFTIAGLRIETYYPGEGHTKDNIVVWFEKEKILYGGCFIKSTESPGLGNVADANIGEWQNSVKRVMKKYPDPEWVIPGHFGWQNRNSLKHTLKLIRKAQEKKR